MPSMTPSPVQSFACVKIGWMRIETGAKHLRFARRARVTRAAVAPAGDERNREQEGDE
jgi:hypothetical protein